MMFQLRGARKYFQKNVRFIAYSELLSQFHRITESDFECIYIDWPLCLYDNIYISRASL